MLLINTKIKIKIYQTSFSSSGRAFFNFLIVSTFNALSALLHSAYYRCQASKDHTNKSKNKNLILNIKVKGLMESCEAIYTHIFFCK